MRLPRKTTSEPSKVVRACGVFTILTWKCASRHNSVHFFDVSTSKKCSEPGVLYTFWLGKCASRHNSVHVFIISTYKSAQSIVCFVHFNFDMCFAPQRRALFQHLNFQMCSERAVFLAFWLANVLRATTACNFSSLIRPDGSAPVALASLPFYLFARLHLLSSDYFSSLIFSLLLFSKSYHLCFSICPYCRKFGF